MSYNDKLDLSLQLTTEELIAALIFDYDNIRFEKSPDSIIPLGPNEEECMDMGRRILAMVLEEFRPDLIADDNWVFNEN